MNTATIVASSTDNRGYWFAERDDTHESIFVHIKNVKGKRFLHIGDRISFDIGVNPKRPNEPEAINIEWIGGKAVSK